MKEISERWLAEAIAIRHRLHQIPELMYEEKQTGDLICSILKGYGYEVQRGVGRTGIVALLDSGKPGKTIAFRADIDALPIAEETGLSYQSKHPGTMHACGHDGHTATLLLVARILQQTQSQLQGKIKLIFQPAEEGGKGSSAMIQDGVLESPHVDAIFGYHNWPGLSLNALATRSGCILAGNGSFEITIPGKRAHLAKPKDAINPVTIGAQMIQKLENLPSSLVTLNVLSFNSGQEDWKKGTSEQAELIGCYFIDGRESLDAFKQKVQAIVGSLGSVVFHEFHAPTLNSPKETELVFAAAEKMGIQEIHKLDTCKMAAEDFSEYLKHVPGCYFLIGAGESKPFVHTSAYDFPDEILAPTARLMVQIAIEAGR